MLREQPTQENLRKARYNSYQTSTKSGGSSMEPGKLNIASRNGRIDTARLCHEFLRLFTGLFKHIVLLLFWITSGQSFVNVQQRDCKISEHYTETRRFDFTART